MSVAEAQARFARVAYAAFLGVTVEDVGPERAVVRLPFREDNANIGGVLHGGATASLIQLAGTLAAWTGIDWECTPSLNTVDLTVQYLRAALQEDMRAEAIVLRRGRDIFFLDVTVRGAAQQLLSKGLMIYRAPDYGTHPRRLYTRPGTFAPPAGDTTPVLSAPSVDFTRKVQIATRSRTPGSLQLTMPCIPPHCDEQGQLHPGALATLLDTAGTHAAWSLANRQGARGSTVGIQLSFPAACQEDVVAEAQVQQRSEELFYSLVQIRTALRGQLVAMGQVSYRLLEARDGVP
ncbi:MAG: PaaI family thioesterase [Candidatus Tectomicrobia bacterium]|uniref:PaaI family thioesterase n=1 Tax=Tectimicrobiota bacterium TaxID=2528274 RepID=A0A938B2W0_UNCTE|nr:PaaI family thioesterase [Candidatus Tectomicrobia bacterium]